MIGSVLRCEEVKNDSNLVYDGKLWLWKTFKETHN
jgi:hypothetical protein